MTTKLKRVLGGLVATAIAASAPLLSASPAAAAPTLEGTATVKTSGGAADLMSGDANDIWTMRLPAGAACLSDGNNGGRAHTYMIPASEDPATDLAFNGSGSLVGQSMATDGVGTFRRNLYNGSTPATNIGLNLGDAVIINIPNLSFNVFSAGNIPSGAYDIGIACVDLDEGNSINRFWNQTIYVTYPGGDTAGAQISWTTIPVESPGLTSVDSQDSALRATFTDGAATNSYTATATPDAADAQCATATAVTSTAATSVTPITIGSLVNDCTYDVVVNEADGALVSNALQGTPALRGPTNVVATPDVARVDLAWTAPVGPTVPTGYTVTGNPSGSTVVVTGTTAAVTDLLCGEAHDLTITPTYAAGTAGTPVAATVEAASYCNQTLEQHITVERPAGALVLTQECGEHGALPAEPAQAGWTDGLQAEDAVAGGVAPFTVWDDATWTGSAPDANHGQYPNPASPAYPTHCGIELGVAEMVTEGEGQGQFFRADGRLHQITVVDTRDTDPLGWTVNGTMSDFKNVDMPGESFSGNALGWTPIVTSTSDAFDHDLDPATSDYDQVATKGDAVAPGANPGLGDGQALASAANGSDLGIAELDARIKLLIPVSAPAGEYQGTLTFTVI